MPPVPVKVTVGLVMVKRNPVGKVSPSTMPLCARALVLVSVNLRLVLPPSVMDALVKVLATVGTPTVSVALAAVPVSTTGPVAAGAVVTFMLVVVAVTLCVIVQVPPGTIVPPVKPTLVPMLAPPLNVPPVHTNTAAALLTSVPV